MYLGSSKIKQRIAEEGLLEDCNLSNIQGSGYDLCIEKLFTVDGPAFLGAEERKLPELQEVEGPTFKLEPGRYCLCVTKESVNMPEDLIAFIVQRSTLFRCGVSLRTAVVDPGYRGALTIGMKNEGTQAFELERGARIAQIVFSEVRGDAEGYSGKYQGGKVV